jgi:ABC-type transporter Mla MlaB component
MGAAAPQTIAFAIYGPIVRDDLAGLCDRVCALLDAGGASLAFCDVRSVPADAVTVDALARLTVAARRYECRIRLRNATDELRSLIAFMGLQNVVAD